MCNAAHSVVGDAAVIWRHASGVWILTAKEGGEPVSSVKNFAALITPTAPATQRAYTPQVRVDFTPLPPAGTLAREWRELQERSDCSLFMSWTWIGCWIESLDGRADLRLLRAHRDGRTVGLGVFAKSLERRNRLIASRTLRLHETGSAELDILTIECNGFLVDRDDSDSIAFGMVDYLVRTEKGWDETVLDALWRMQPWPDSDLRVKITAKVSHYVDLDQVRTRRGDYLSLPGRNTRAKIRRSIKEFGKSGPFRVRCAADVPEALDYLDGLLAFAAHFAGAAHRLFQHWMRHAAEAVHGQCHRTRHAQQRHLALHGLEFATAEFQRAAVGGGRILFDVEKVFRSRLFIHRVHTEIDAGRIDGDIDRSGLPVAIQRDVAAALVELAAPDGQAHMRELNAGKCVLRIDRESIRCAGGHRKNRQRRRRQVQIQ